MRSVGFQPAEPLRVWAVSDGRAGIENQALGLAEAIARRAPAEIETKHVSLRTPYSWMPPGFTPASRHALSINSDAISPPWPHIWIGCGRASVPLSMGMRKWANGRTFVVQLQDPRVNPREFDAVAPPIHDELEGRNVVPMVGACNRITNAKLEESKLNYPRVLEELQSPRFAVLIGGKSKRQDISGKRARDISETLTRLQRMSGGTLMATVSRRTGPAARAQFRVWLAPHCEIFYEGEGPNPYFAMLAAAEFIFVTADSVNMATEAASTGKPIYILDVDGHAGKIEKFHHSLIKRGCARPFTGRLERWSYPPLQETDRVAGVILNAWTQKYAQR